MGRHFPRLKRDVFLSIINRLGLTVKEKKRKKGKGSHVVYAGLYKGRQILMSVPDHGEFDSYYTEQLTSQSGLTKEQLYGLSKESAAAARVPYLESLPDPVNPSVPRGGLR